MALILPDGLVHKKQSFLMCFFFFWLAKRKLGVNEGVESAIETSKGEVQLLEHDAIGCNGMPTNSNPGLKKQVD